jgi:small subunit ribosomal protein S17
MNNNQKVNKGRVVSGVVVRKSGEKTVAVEVVRVERHKLYGKKKINTKKFLAHDADGKAEVGDKVNITECRPMSRLKRWTIIKDKK